MPRYCYDKDLIGLFAPLTCRNAKHQYRQRDYEDQLDHLHRLAKMGCRPETIERHTGIPLESVEYVLIRNGYKQGDKL